MSRYGVVGKHSGELLTYQGKAIVHDNRAEMEFLLPNSRVVRLSDGRLRFPWMWLREHPDMAATRFPLRREDFPGG